MTIGYAQFTILGFEPVSNTEINVVCKTVLGKTFTVKAPGVIISVLWMLKNEPIFIGERIHVGSESFEGETPRKPFMKSWTI
jgi:hypothetical protein